MSIWQHETLISLLYDLKLFKCYTYTFVILVMEVSIKITSDLEKTSFSVLSLTYDTQTHLLWALINWENHELGEVFKAAFWCDGRFWWYVINRDKLLIWVIFRLLLWLIKQAAQPCVTFVYHCAIFRQQTTVCYLSVNHHHLWCELINLSYFLVKLNCFQSTRFTFTWQNHTFCN